MDRRGPLRVGLALVVVLGGCVACGGDPGAGPEQVAPSPSSSSSSGAATARPTPVTPLPAASPSALDDLLPFLTAAAELDAQLHATAPLVSASVHDTEVVVEQSTAEAVRALDVEAVAATIPDGVPDDLLTPVLVVYSELVSRVLAMSGFGYAGTYALTTDEADSTDGQSLVACLANGSEAARRFAGDLAAVRAAAEAAAPVADVDPTSPAAATLAVRLEDIGLRNGGCGGCGGHLVDGLATVEWDDESTTTRTGSVGTQGEPGGVAFTATYEPVGGWTVVLNAC